MVASSCGWAARSTAGDLARNVDLVLDRHRHPEQRLAIAACSALVHAIGVGERSSGEDRAERVQFAVESLDPSKCQFEQLARGRLATPHELGLSGHTVERRVVFEHRLPTLSSPR